jgi:hypothetical protein
MLSGHTASAPFCCTQYEALQEQLEASKLQAEQVNQMGLLHLTCCQATQRQQLCVVRMQAAALKQQCEALQEQLEASKLQAEQVSLMGLLHLTCCQATWHQQLFVVRRSEYLLANVLGTLF